MTNSNDTINAIVNPISGNVEQGGLTKREYFAALAMQGMCANECYAGKHSNSAIEISVKSCEIADALIKELNK